MTVLLPEWRNRNNDQLEVSLKNLHLLSGQQINNNIRYGDR